jgi:hypothetical protein
MLLEYNSVPCDYSLIERKPKLGTLQSMISRIA